MNHLLFKVKFPYKDLGIHIIKKIGRTPIASVADPKLLFRIRYRIRIRPLVSFGFGSGFESGFESWIRIRIQILDLNPDGSETAKNYFS
jgi:hypothetical protein